MCKKDCLGDQYKILCRIYCKIETDNGVDCNVIIEYVLLKWMNDCTNHRMMWYYLKWHEFFCIFDYFKRLLQNCTTAYFPFVIQSVSFCFIFSAMPFRKPVITSAFYNKNIITLNITIWRPISIYKKNFTTTIFWIKIWLTSVRNVTKGAGWNPRRAWLNGVVVSQERSETSFR